VTEGTRRPRRPLLISGSLGAAALAVACLGVFAYPQFRAWHALRGTEAVWWSARPGGQGVARDPEKVARIVASARRLLLAGKAVEAPRESSFISIQFLPGQDQPQYPVFVIAAYEQDDSIVVSSSLGNRRVSRREWEDFQAVLDGK
jgi:hypothetical protein